MSDEEHEYVKVDYNYNKLIIIFLNFIIYTRLNKICFELNLCRYN